MILELKLTNDWLEATWYTEEDEVKTQVHCEYFSGHPEHIAMLRAKASEYGTTLDETLIKECIANFVMPTEPTTEELEARILAEKVAEAKQYLVDTDFKFNDDYDQKDIPEWLEIKAKRAEAREFVRANS